MASSATLNVISSTGLFTNFFSNPSTFSMIANTGFNISIALICLKTSKLRGSLPFLAPATEKPWHGGPPATNVTVPAISLK